MGFNLLHTHAVEAFQNPHHTDKMRCLPPLFHLPKCNPGTPALAAPLLNCLTAHWRLGRWDTLQYCKGPIAST